MGQNQIENSKTMFSPILFRMGGGGGGRDKKWNDPIHPARDCFALVSLGSKISFSHFKYYLSYYPNFEAQPS